VCTSASASRRPTNVSGHPLASCARAERRAQPRSAAVTASFVMCDMDRLLPPDGERHPHEDAMNRHETTRPNATPPAERSPLLRDGRLPPAALMVIWPAHRRTCGGKATV